MTAQLVTLASQHLHDFKEYWRPRLESSRQGDRHWSWLRKHKATELMLNHEKYAIECDRLTQGLMMLEVDLHRSRQAADKHLVYVDFLATAPWNRYSMQDIPDYKGVGSAMLDYAIWRSLELGYGGRIGLHALPEAEGFYSKRNLVNFGADLDKEHLTYFELGDASE
ncbi:MAG: hypothetical protein ACFE0J_16110 [Elainellaceae cyanobacterium]